MFERFVTPLLFFIAWLFLLLVTLSVPIIKSLNLFHINADVEVGVSVVSASAKVAINYACAFTFLALLFALLASFRANQSKSRIPSLLASGFGIFAALLTTIVFIVDVVFVSIVKSKLKDHTDGAATANYGAAVWLVLVAAILLWVASFGACCGILKTRRARRAEAEKY
ncbi:hypothetical protein FS837_003330 [Tulasnella sp. UAMH 9824]|nr:hypothetical protein FS837_003330 [Tulasnella sp. UAMH 9824]